MKYIIFVLLLFSLCAFSAEFGEYNYSSYVGIQQQLQNQRAIALMKQRKYNSSPTRRIKYPTSDNPYPNIQTTPHATLTARQRYSPQYYSTYY